MTAPDQPVTVSSVTCQCCDVRWPSAPLYPESWICTSCAQWIEGFTRAANTSGHVIPIVGPVKTIRRLLWGEDVTTTEYLADTSAWVAVYAHPDVHTRLGQLTEPPEPAEPDDDEYHLRNITT